MLEAARQAGIRIPTLCYLEGREPIGACRVCLVEIEGARTLVASCSHAGHRGHEGAHQQPARCAKARRTVVELLLSEHDGDCQTCARSDDCELRKPGPGARHRRAPLPGRAHQARRRLVDPGARPRHRQVHHVPPLRHRLQRDPGRRRALRAGPRLRDRHRPGVRRRPRRRSPACSAASAPWSARRGDHRARPDRARSGTRSTTRPRPSSCRPPRRSAPRSASASACAPGTLVTGKMVAALRRLGFDAVFDTNFTADLTIMEEGTELLLRLKKALVDGERVALPHDHELLAGLDQLHRALLPRHAAATSPPASRPSRCSAPWPRPTTPRRSGMKPEDMRRRLDHALHGEEVRGAAARDGRQRRAATSTSC